LALFRHHHVSGKKLLIVANLDDRRKALGAWDPLETGMEGTSLMDLVTGEPVVIETSDKQHACHLDPGRVFCLTADEKDMDLILNAESQTAVFPERISRQRFGKNKQTAIACQGPGCLSIL